MSMPPHAYKITSSTVTISAVLFNRAICQLFSYFSLFSPPLLSPPNPCCATLFGYVAVSMSMSMSMTFLLLDGSLESERQRSIVTTCPLLNPIAGSAISTSITNHPPNHYHPMPDSDRSLLACCSQPWALLVVVLVVVVLVVVQCATRTHAHSLHSSSLTKYHDTLVVVDCPWRYSGCTDPRIAASFPWLACFECYRVEQQATGRTKGIHDERVLPPRCSTIHTLAHHHCNTATSVRVPRAALGVFFRFCSQV
jgi:hypothetical protein